MCIEPPFPMAIDDRFRILRLCDHCPCTSLSRHHASTRLPRPGPSDVLCIAYCTCKMLNCNSTIKDKYVLCRCFNVAFLKRHPGSHDTDDWLHFGLNQLFCSFLREGVDRPIASQRHPFLVWRVVLDSTHFRIIRPPKWRIAAHRLVQSNFKRPNLPPSLQDCITLEQSYELDILWFRCEDTLCRQTPVTATCPLQDSAFSSQSFCGFRKSRVTTCCPFVCTRRKHQGPPDRAENLVPS